MKNVLAIGRDPSRLFALDQILSDCIDGNVYLGVNEHNLFRGLAQRQYDMLVIDLDAVDDEAAGMIRKIRNKWPRLEVVVTGPKDVEDIADALLSAGANRVLGRPIKRTIWLRLVRSIERRARVA